MVQLNSTVKNTHERLNIFESNLAKNLTAAINQTEEQEFNCHIEFKREDKLPPGEYKKFEKIKMETYKYFSEINKDREVNRYFLDNLVCRYLLVKKYKEEETLKALKKYLDWQKFMRNTYTM